MLNVINKEIKELFADRKIWIGILMVLIITIIGTSYNVQNTEISSGQLKLGVINKDNSTYSRLLLEYFTQSNTFSSLITVIQGDEGEIEKAFDQGDLDIYLEIPEDFAVNMLSLEHVPVNVTLNISDTTKAILFENVLRSYEKYISGVEANATGLYKRMEQEGMDHKLIDETNRKLSLELILTALGKEAFFNFQQKSGFPATTLAFYYLSSVLVMVLLYFGLYEGLQLLREMKQGTFARLLTTRLPLYQFLIGKTVIIIFFAAAVMSAAIFTLCRQPITAGGLFFCLAISMFAVCEAVFLCVLFPGMQQFILTGNVLVFYFTILGGGIIPIQFLPQDILRISKLTPFFYIQRGIIQINQGQYLICSQIALAFFLLSIGLFAAAVIHIRKRSVRFDEV